MAALDPSSCTGRRDQAPLDVAAQPGPRVSELTGLRNFDIELGAGAHLRCRGKGRKDRCMPLSRQTAAVLRVWMHERGGDPADPLFPSRLGTALSPGAVATLGDQARSHRQAALPVTAQAPHPPYPAAQLRHGPAAKRVHTAVIALWLGHERVETTSRAYLHVSIKERALARTAPLQTKPGRCWLPDRLLAFLDSR